MQIIIIGEFMHSWLSSTLWTAINVARNESEDNKRAYSYPRPTFIFIYHNPPY